MVHLPSIPLPAPSPRRLLIYHLPLGIGQFWTLCISGIIQYMIICAHFFHLPSCFQVSFHKVLISDPVSSLSKGCCLRWELNFSVLSASLKNGLIGAQPVLCIVNFLVIDIQQAGRTETNSSILSDKANFHQG